MSMRAGSFIRVGFATVLLLSAALVSGCADYGDPSATVQTMITASNQGDINSMIAQFEPAVQETYEGGMGVGTGIFKSLTGIDIDLKDVASLMPALSELARADGQEMPSMKMHQSKFVMDDTHTYACVMADVTMNTPDENGVMQTQRQWAPFLLKRLDGEWKILGMPSSIEEVELAWPELTSMLEDAGLEVEARQ